ncbi:MAG TPA: hypothetical protein VH186_28755 [Chloroflexia bacterium]|nr:hypothetical protein [Chloroflexia bacterium]
MPDQRGSQSSLSPAHDNEENQPDITAEESGEQSSAKDEGSNQRQSQPRAQIRAAINSVHHTSRFFNRANLEPQTPAREPTPLSTTDAADGGQPALDEAALKRAAEVESLIAKAQVLARQGKVVDARRALTRVVQLDPENSEGWTWLGGLMMSSNLESSRLCLAKAVELDPTNQRARQGLAQVVARLQPAPPEPVAAEAETVAEAHELAEQEQVAEGTEETGVHVDRQLSLRDPELELAEETQAEEEIRAIEPARPDIRIGLEEAVENLRQSGEEADPEHVPMGGARIRPAIEKGEIDPKKLRRRKRLFPWLNLSNGYSRSMFILGIFLCICLIGLLIAVAPTIGEALKSPPPTPTLEPTATPPPLTADESFASRLRVEIDYYNRVINNARGLRQQVQSGKMVWGDYRNNIQSLQADLKSHKSTLDSLATGATPKLLPYYRELVNIATASMQAIDYTMSGVENTNPEDLEEGNSQFNDTARRLAELIKRLNQTSPVPTPVPTATPRPTSTPVMTASDTAGTTPDLSSTPAPTDVAGTASPVSSPGAADTAVAGTITPGVSTPADANAPPVPPTTPAP